MRCRNGISEFCLLLVQLLVEDHKLRWRLYGSPAETLELANEVASALVKDRARFLDDMLVQQVTKPLHLERLCSKSQFWVPARQ